MAGPGHGRQPSRAAAPSYFGSWRKGRISITNSVLYRVLLRFTLPLLLLWLWFASKVPLSDRMPSSLLAAARSPPIHIAVTVDSSYTVGLLALMNSTWSNTRTPRSVVWHVLSSSADSVKEVQDLVLSMPFTRPYKRNIRFYDISEQLQQAAHLKVWAGYRSESLSRPIVYARYSFARLFPNIDRLIYADIDNLVLKDIRELWDVDLEGKPLGAVRLCRAEFRKAFNMKQEVLASYDHDECVMNNGVLVYDLEKWRQHDYEEQLFKWSILNSETKLYELGSQPPFNLVFYKNYKILDSRFNTMDLAGLKDSDGHVWTVTPERMRKAVVIHWNGSFKPWNCEHGNYAELWHSYLPNFRQYRTIGEQKELDTCHEVVWTRDHQIASDEEKFTVVIVSFARRDNILKIMRLLRKSDFVQDILLVWNDPDTPCPEEAAPLSRCIHMNKNLVHNRFAIWNEVRTEGVLIYDDDILVPIPQLEAAFSVWLHHKTQLLGFEPRVIREEADGPHYRFRLTEGYFDLVIGKMFFVHVNYLKKYMESPKLVELSSDSPCEDLAMNFMIGESTKLPPLLFQANITELHSKVFDGLSQTIQSDVWREKRHSCITELLKLFDNKAPVEKQFSKFTLVEAKNRLLQQKIPLNDSWCSDVNGSRPCRQP